MSRSNHFFFLLLFPFILGCFSSNQENTHSSNNESSSLSPGCPAKTNTVNQNSQPFLKNFGKYKSLSTSIDPPNRNQSLSKLVGHVPPHLNEMTDQGKLENDPVIAIALSLKLNHTGELETLLANLYNPNHPDFHHFLTSEEFVNRFSPTETQVNYVNEYLNQNGIQVTSVDKNRILIHAAGLTSKINQLFNTELHQYKDQKGKKYYAPAYELQAQSDLQIEAINGLENITHLKTHFRTLETGPAPQGKIKPSTIGSGPNGGMSPSDIKTAYQIPSTLNGNGQVLALFELDGYTANDITAYENQFGISPIPLQNIFVDSVTGSAGDGAAEVTLDIELMAAVSPGVSKILIYEGPNTSQGVLDTYNRIATDHLASVVSTSWGSTENQSESSFTQTEYKIFQQMAAQGQSNYAAAGDNGAYDDGSNLSVDDPASQPYMVGVGGTKLTVNSDQSYSKETVWNTNGGGGGGISSIWTLPTWQKKVATPSNQGSTTMRNVPDVALNADPSTGYAIYYNKTWSIFGGTSCAAPIWAAFTALVNQRRIEHGQTVLGFPNPALYQIGISQNYSTSFHDLADNSKNLFYPAVSGYDNATGWGSFIREILLVDLVSDSASTPGGSGSTAISCP